MVPSATLERLAKERTHLTHALHRLHAGTDERQLLLASALAAIETADGRATGTADLVAQALDRTAPDSDYRPVALAAAAALAARDADDAVELEHGRDRPEPPARLLLPRDTIQHLRGEPTATLTDLQGPPRELA
ncbi:hypothetical protein ACEYXF_26100, partial [Streptomyces asiaticus]|uniref:hypothetical protein n=1 Tax=Streptomyces asiaticus TaxID=114695 RepID=UPI0039BEA0D6